MPKRRRLVTLILVGAVLVLCGIGGGLWWFYQNSGTKLLDKAELALKANRFERALELAGDYIQEKPGDWRGYFVQAQAHLASGRYEESRKSLEQAAKVRPEEISVPILLAETYAAPARKAVISKDLAQIRAGIRQFQKAEEVLSMVQSKDANEVLGVEMRTGLTQMQIGRALEALSSLANEEALGLIARRDANAAAERQNDSNVARADSREAFAKATRTLLGIARRDANRPDAASLLVQLCMQQKDANTLAEVRKAILAASDPPPDAVLMLAQRDIQASADRYGTRPGLTPEANEICGVLDWIIAGHPDDVQAKAVRANLAGRVPDPNRVKVLHREIIEANLAEPGDRLIQAKILLQDGNLVEAEQKLSGLLAKYGQMPDVQYTYARLALATGKADMAAEALRALSKMALDDPQSKLMQAQLALRLGDLPAARQFCEEAVRTDPNSAVARFLRGQVFTRLGDLGRAETDLAGLDKNWPEARVAYARLAIQKGDLPAALAAAQDATRLDPNNDEARGLLAELQMRAGDAESISPTEAFANAQKYYQARPNDPGALGLFVRAAHRANQDALAREELRKAMASSSAGPQLLMIVGEGYSMLQDANTSLEAVKRAAEAGGTSPEDRMAVASALERLRRGSEAVQLLSDEVRKNPGRADLHYQLGRALAAVGNWTMAAEQYRAAVDLDKGNASYHRALAEALQNSGDIDGARKVLDEMGSSRVFADTDSSRAAMYAARKQWQECINLCKSHLDKDPNDADFRRTYAVALLGSGQEAVALQQFDQLLRQEPDQLSPYMDLAGTLSRKGDANQTLRHIAGILQALEAPIPGARTDMVNLAVGTVFLRSDEPNKAIDLLAHVAASATATESMAGLARLRLIQSYSSAGDANRALAEVDLLDKSKAFARGAKSLRVMVLIDAKRFDQAGAPLDEIVQLAAEEKDISLLQKIPALYVKMEKNDKALAVCDQLQKLAPNDSRTYQTRAEVLLAADKPTEAIESLRKAIELQPIDYSLQVELAMALESAQRFTEALEILRKLEDAGPGAASHAAMQRGLMLTRWGLYGQAAECFTKLLNSGYDDSQGDAQLALAQDLIQLGESNRAAEVLKQVPNYAGQYVRAQLLLAAITPSDDARLKIVRALPQSEPTLLEEMALQMRRGRPAEAVKVFLDANVNPRAKSPTVSLLAVQAMFESGDRPGARNLALRLAQETGDLRLRHVAALYAMDDSSRDAKALLPDPNQADAFTALLGFCLAHVAKDANAEKQWLDRFAAAGKQVDQTDPTILAPFRLLVCLVQGDTDQAKAVLPMVRSVPGFGKTPAGEQVSSAAANPNAREESFALLKSSLAITASQYVLAKTWPRSLLRARPTCQWAAALAFESEPNAQAQRQVLEMLQPRDCPVALILTAELAEANSDYAAAADWYGKVAKTDDSVEILMKQATNAEYAGRLEEAMALYRRVRQITPSPTVSNNIAYLSLRMYPKDPGKLAEAQSLVEEALKQRPRESSFRDTLGWAAYLRGNYEQACTELRKAVAGMPRQPEVHCHLAMAESACGRTELARWHYMAAVSLGKAMAGQGRPLPAETAQVLQLSQQALDALGPSR